jgi:hypothetical protein
MGRGGLRREADEPGPVGDSQPTHHSHNSRQESASNVPRGRLAFDVSTRKSGQKNRKVNDIKEYPI